MHSAPIELFWYWVNERHSISIKKAAGLSRPWSDDEIFQKYKFTNVFRQLDTGTVWLTEHFIKPYWEAPPELLLFNVAWYRLFNWVGTGERLGWQQRWWPSAIKRTLTRALNDGEQVFTGAHIIRSEFGRPKIESVVDTCTAIWEKRRHLANVAKFHRSLEQVFSELTLFRMVGGFMAYEIVTDLRHTPLLNQAHDINTWANAGPGAVRGLKRLLPDHKATVANMRLLLAASRDNTASYVPQMELRDIEHSLCEFDKYCRVKFGEGRPRGRYNGTEAA